jgi:uncharacterized repeat protein (TIGR03803 family)
MKRAGYFVGSLLILFSALAVWAHATTTDTVLVNFDTTGYPGQEPCYHLTLSRTGGVLYGTTDGGTRADEANICAATGTPEVFSYAPSTGAFSAIYSFSSGDYPNSPVVEDSAGNLYGTTYYNGGYLYELSYNGSTWSKTILHTFGSSGDAKTAVGELAIGSLQVNGESHTAIFGTSDYGGSDSSNCNSKGCGTIWVYDLTAGTESVLYSFTYTGTASTHPWSGVQIGYTTNGSHTDETLFGTSEGAEPFESPTYPNGAVWQYDVDTATFSAIHDFQGGTTDGANPYDVPFQDSSGILYGTTASGGSHSLGTIWKIDTSGTETLLYNFLGYSSDGSNPAGHLVLVGSKFYGTTVGGGSNNKGTLFSLVNNSGTWTETVKYSFAGASSDGQTPVNAITQTRASVGTSGMYLLTVRGG